MEGWQVKLKKSTRNSKSEGRENLKKQDLSLSFSIDRSIDLQKDTHTHKSILLPCTSNNPKMKFIKKSIYNSIKKE